MSLISLLSLSVGTLPNKTEGIVNRTACVDYGRESRCEEELPIMIKNCNGSYVYFLTSPEACPAAYCFGILKLHYYSSILKIKWFDI